MIDCISREKALELGTLISGARKVVVAAHVHPDGDAIGSVTAMGLFLQRVCGKQVSCLFPDQIPENLLFVTNSSLSYFTWDKDADTIGPLVSEADLVILQDCNDFIRTEGLAQSLSESTAPKVLIDHHLNPATEKFTLTFSTPQISSASELLFWVLKALGWDLADNQIGAALLTGMTTDTNNFANSVFPTTLTMASELIASGVDRDEIIRQVYQCYRENRIRIMGYMQYEGLTVLPEGAAYMILTKDIQDRFDIKEGETEGLVNVPLAIENVKISLLLKENGDHFRVSLRSKKGTSAQNCAVRFFNGGGHENAAGGKIFPKDLGGESLESYAKRALLEILK